MQPPVNVYLPVHQDPFLRDAFAANRQQLASRWTGGVFAWKDISL